MKCASLCLTSCACQELNFEFYVWYHLIGEFELSISWNGLIFIVHIQWNGINCILCRSICDNVLELCPCLFVIQNLLEVYMHMWHWTLEYSPFIIWS